MQHTEVLRFWFEELTAEQHFTKDLNLDEQIKTRFGDVHTAAKQGELFDWRATPEGRLAEVIVLDQFSRNMFRGLPESFASDPVALVLADVAIAAGDDVKLKTEQRYFLYMPFMHSESRLIHKTAMELFKQPGLESAYEYEIRHKAIIDRFGRYPHRNDVLGRTSTPEELEFLKGPHSSF